MSVHTGVNLSVSHLELLRCRVARWFLFKPKVQIWVNFEGLNWKMLVYFIAIWNNLQTFGICYDHLENFVYIWYIFRRFGKLYQKNLATLLHSSVGQAKKMGCKGRSRRFDATAARNPSCPDYKKKDVSSISRAGGQGPILEAYPLRVTWGTMVHRRKKSWNL
jgi:hypothetical protein